MNGIIKKVNEKRLAESVLAAERKITNVRIQQLKSEILELLDGATSHPQIGAALPKFEQFFKSLTANEFTALLESDELDAQVYIVLWYHCGATMHKAVKCALFSKERMILLYPLWRFYADESDTYI